MNTTNSTKGAVSPWSSILRECAFTAAVLVGLWSSQTHAATRSTYVKALKIYQVGDGGGDTESLGEAMARSEIAGRAAVKAPYVITEISDWQSGPYQPEHGYLQYVAKGPAIYIRKFKAVSTEDPSQVLSGGFGFSVWLTCPVNSGRYAQSDFYLDGWNYQWYCGVNEEASTPQACHGPKAGNPIDVFSGRKEERIPLLSGPVSVDLFYNSKEGWRPSFAEVLFDRTGGGSPITQEDCVNASFEDGRGGTKPHCFQKLRLSEITSEPPEADVFYQRPDGSYAEFVKPGRSATAGVATTLEIRNSSTAKFVVRQKGDVRIFDDAGRLTQVARPDGGGYALTYLQLNGTRTDPAAPACLRATVGSGQPGQPSCLTDRATGRQVNLFYGPDGLYRLVGAAGETYEITYNGPSSVVRSERRLLSLITSITFPEGGIQRFGYNEDGRTGGADLPHAMTSKSDLAGLPFASFNYQADGRAMVSEYLEGIGRTEVVRSASDQMSYSIIGPDGVERSVKQDQKSYVLAPGVIQVASFVGSNQQPAGSGCAAASAESRYSQAGFLSEQTDLNGVKTCYTVDEETGKEQLRVEGKGRWDWCPGVTEPPEGGRRISTEWHPKWQLETRVAEPYRITTTVYNGQPDPFNGNAIASCAPPEARLPDGDPVAVICKRVVQATTDTNGSQAFSAILQAGVAARTSSWTYNANGQLLTEKDARNNTILNNVYYMSASSDHAAGDLQSSANAANHLSRFTRYNAAGAVIETIGPNDLTSVFYYDERQRLTSLTVAGARTSYEYWPNGLLKRTTQPDLSTVDYQYDAGQRLVAVVDSTGNRIEYTLDANGLRTKEDTKDPQGTLKRTLSRVYDALGRAQQMTGGN